MPEISQPAQISNRAIWTRWVLSGLVVLFMLFDGAIKLVPLDIVTQSATQLGLPASAGFARGLGILGLICTALYVFPRTSVLGAILLTAYMGGTVATHLRVGSPVFSTMLFGVYLAVIAWGGLYLRDSRIRALIPFSR
jgi:hypothetical protein